ncbi:MAG: efflux RND transporter periplasmic adaptor subunit, partial [Isosphaeraceae bacterium]|nr:efflux RND transporter periplasmic adaptor subunit [Isosphaeraceae bacterium]
SPTRPSRGGGDGVGIRITTIALWLIPLLLVGGLGRLAYLQYDKIRPKAEVTVGLVQAMTTGEAEKLLSAKGYIKSRNQAMIGAKVPGRVEQMNVEEGMKVKAGQVLAVLEHNDLKAQLESRKAMLRRSEGELKEARADFELKDRKAQRWSRLLNRGATPEEVDQALADRAKAAARLTALEAAIELQKAMIHETEETIRNMHIIAPFDATVVSKEAEVGETITPGGMGAASGRGSVATIADLDHLEVETDIAESLMARVAVGQPAEIAVSAVPGKHYRGRLRRIIPMGDRTRGTVKVKVEILDPDEHLFPELVATVHFLPNQALNRPDTDKPSPFVPKAAIVEEGGHSYVWVVDGKPSIHKRWVEVVVTNDDLARVEAGLEAGESVVLSPAKTLRDGERVKVAD